MCVGMEAWELELLWFRFHASLVFGSELASMDCMPERVHVAGTGKVEG